jgi:hypothetical protein
MQSLLHKLLACSIIVAGLAGCSGSSGNPNLVPVTGSVTLDGQPLAGASVAFVAAGDTAGAGGVGITDESGKYHLAHFREGTGAEPGEYKVLISKIVLPDGSPIPPGTTSVAELQTRNLVPARYSDYYNTVLKAVVTQVGTSTGDFALTSR